MNLSRNIVTTLAARTAILVLSLMSSILLARTLGPEGRGLFALVLLVPALAECLGLLGFEQANAVYAGLEPGGRRALAWHSLATAAVVGGAIVLGGTSFFIFEMPGSESLLQGPLWLYVLPLTVIPLTLLTQYWGAILRGMNRILLVNCFEVGAKVASLTLMVVFVIWLELEVGGAVWGHVLAVASALLLVGVLLKRAVGSGKPAFDSTLWKRTAVFALPMYAGMVAAYLNYRVDEFFIAGLLSPSQLGLYVIAVGIVEQLWILTGSVSTALLPHLTTSPNRDAGIPAVISRHVVLWTAAACIFLFVFADPVVRLMFSSAFVSAVDPLRWLLPGVLVLSVGKVLVAELLARKKPHYSLWATVIATVTNVIGNLALIPLMGISGAALASSISYSLLSVMIAWCYLRETGLSWTVLVPRVSDLHVYSVMWARLVGRAPQRGNISQGA